MTKAVYANSLNYSLPWPGLSDDHYVSNTTLALYSILDGLECPIAAQDNTQEVDGKMVNGRLIVSQFNMLGIPPTHYDYYTNSYGSGQKLRPADIDPLVVAYHCEFYFCLQAFAAKATAGETRQELVST